jgi:hypothetical protein
MPVEANRVRAAIHVAGLTCCRARVYTRQRRVSPPR